MKLYPPLKISARLLPAVQIGNAWVSVDPTGNVDHYGKPEWRFYVDISELGIEYEDDDLFSFGGPREALASLLSFLGAAAEAGEYEKHTGRSSDNSDLFPEPIVKWAMENSDEISILTFELEES